MSKKNENGSKTDVPEAPKVSSPPKPEAKKESPPTKPEAKKESKPSAATEDRLARAKARLDIGKIIVEEGLTVKQASERWERSHMYIMRCKKQFLAANPQVETAKA